MRRSKIKDHPHQSVFDAEIECVVVRLALAQQRFVAQLHYDLQQCDVSGATFTRRRRSQPHYREHSVQKAAKCKVLAGFEPAAFCVRHT